MKFPLTFKEIVHELVCLTSLPREEVEYRVWMEALDPGWNVLQDVARFGVTPHKYDEKMLQLYHDGDSFIFETLVFWLKPKRRRWTQYALERIRSYAERSNIDMCDISILIFGDGTGSDSLFLADKGLKINYYDIPGSKTFDFALKRFDYYNMLGQHIKPINDYRACLTRQYDVVISFEVLEHLQQPLQAIRDISSMLKYGGISLITDDFGNIANSFPTHLEINSTLHGKTPFLFLDSSMVLSWYSRDELFKPFEFIKLKEVSTKHWLSLFRDYNIRKPFLSKNSSILLRSVGKLPYIGY